MSDSAVVEKVMANHSLISKRIHGRNASQLSLVDVEFNQTRASNLKVTNKERNDISLLTTSK